MNNLSLETSLSRRQVMSYIAQITPRVRRAECATLVRLLEMVTGHTPVLCPGNIIGFGRYTNATSTGTREEIPLLAFAPRKHDVVMYTLRGVEHWSLPFSAQIQALGKIKVGRGCLYIKRLKDLDIQKLSTLLSAIVIEIRGRAPQEINRE